MIARFVSMVWESLYLGSASVGFLLMVKHAIDLWRDKEWSK